MAYPETEKKEHYHSLIENLPIGVYRNTPGPLGRIIVANSAYMRMFGIASREQLETLCVADFYQNPADRKHFSDKLLAEGSVTGLVLALKKLDGTPIWGSVTARVVHADDGQVAFFDCTIEDVTERRRAEAAVERRAYEFSVLFDTAQDLATTLDLETLLIKTVERAVALLSANAGAIFLYDPNEKNLRLTIHSGCDLPRELKIALAEGMPGRVAAERRTAITADYAELGMPIPSAGALSFSSAIGVPMLFGGELIGVILVYQCSTGSRPLSEADGRLLSLYATQSAAAVHNLQLLEQAQFHADQLARLYDASVAINRIREPHNQLAALCEIAVKALQGDHAEFYRYNPAHDAMSLEFATRPEQDAANALTLPTSYPNEGGPLEQVMRTRAVLHVPRLAADPYCVAAYPRYQAGIWIPIEYENLLLGVLAVFSTRSEKLVTPDERMLALFVNQVAVAMENARLFQETTRSLSRVQALRAIDNAITNTLDMRVTLSVLLDQVTGQLRVHAANILLFNPHLQTLEYAAGRGFDSRFQHPARLRIGEGLAGRAALERRLLQLRDVVHADHTHTLTRWLEAEGFRAYCAAPLIAKGQLKGVLQVMHRTPLDMSGEWSEFLQTLATQAAIAIDSGELFVNLQRFNAELTLAYETTLEGWSRALDLRDKETEGHTERVTALTLALAQALGVGDSDIIHMRRGALLHDIGKMGIPDSILLKPGPLTLEEWVTMRLHPVYAYELLSPIDYLRSSIDIPYSHHERWDGQGYPHGLAGEQIPLSARLFAIVDVWDALTNDRPYRPAWPQDRAREYLIHETGKSFDPAIMPVFLNLI